jgi:ABC-type transport system substrate-binding protein
MEAQRAEARKILEEEGFPFDKTFVMTVESDEQVQARATFIQEQLRLIGVKTDFDLVETVAWREKAAQGTWGDILPRNDTMPSADPALGMGFYFRCNSANNHWGPGTECDPKSEGLLDQLAASTDQAERKSLSDELQVYTMEQYWRYPIYWEQEAMAFWPEVRGYVHHPAPNSSFIKWSTYGLTHPTKTTRDSRVRPQGCLEAFSLIINGQLRAGPQPEGRPLNPICAKTREHS